MAKRRIRISRKLHNVTARPGTRIARSVPPSILILNAGSSSIKFAVYTIGAPLTRRFGGEIDRIGLTGTHFSINGSVDKPQSKCRIHADDHGSAAMFLLDYLACQPAFASVKAVGHRVVHGMKYSRPQRITSTLLTALQRIALCDPDHLPRELQLIRAFGKQHPELPQVACFDTAFHQTMPNVAKCLPIPRRYMAKGIQRYGFHGLSYAFLMEELARLGDPAAKKGRVILAHLGNGASLAAVRNGASIDTSMGFTPAAGLMMSTRSGDLDPGIIGYLSRAHAMTAAGFEKMVNHESGLLGVSATSPDVRDLLAKEEKDARAAQALDMFCYQVKKWIGSFAAALGGVDTLVFAGGIGENAPVIRRRICQDLAFLGIRLDPVRNTHNASIISAHGAAVSVRVIHTNEELMIARCVSRLLNL